jgi:hypothetical protein
MINRENVKWEVYEPKGQERKTLYTKRKTCILIPPTASESKVDLKNYKFPICSSPAATALKRGTSAVEYNCRGLLAANRRARLSKYPDVEKLTRTLLDRWTCTKKAEKEMLKTKKTKK